MPSPLPFTDFRQSSASSIDVQLEANGPFVGLASVAGIDAGQLLSHAKSGLDAAQQACLLLELPRLLMWNGCDAVSVDDHGNATFAEGQKITVELEDAGTGEIDEREVVCTTAIAELAAVNADAKGTTSSGWGAMPKVGLEAAAQPAADESKGKKKKGGAHHGHGRHAGHSHGNVPCTGHGADSDGENEWADTDGEEEAEEEAEDDGADQRQAKVLPAHPIGYRARALHELFTDTCGLATMVPLPAHVVKECYLAAGGNIVDPKVVEGLGAENEDEDEEGGHAHAGGQQCQQQ